MYVRKCSMCQSHDVLINAPDELLYSIITPWPFYRWGIDILDPFPDLSEIIQIHCSSN